MEMEFGVVWFGLMSVIDNAYNGRCHFSLIAVLRLTGQRLSKDGDPHRAVALFLRADACAEPVFVHRLKNDRL